MYPLSRLVMRTDELIDRKSKILCDRSAGFSRKELLQQHFALFFKQVPIFNLVQDGYAF